MPTSATTDEELRELSPAQLVYRIRQLERYCDEMLAERNRLRTRHSATLARCEMLEEEIAWLEERVTDEP